MGINAYKNLIAQNLFNIPGWRTSRKFVVIESDDWGSLRMPTLEIYNKLLNKGIRVDKCPYCQYDTLEAENDLEALFEVLSSFRDFNHNSPVITANFIMANPSFDKIKASRFQDYYYQKFTDTYKNYPESSNSFSLVKEGLTSNIFVPQLHGREHLNVIRWMKALQLETSETRDAFNLGVYGLSTTVTRERRKSYLPAFDFDSEKETLYHTEIINEAISLFRDIFGYNSTTFIAPNYTWHQKLEKDLSLNNIKVLQGSRYQIDPSKPGKNKRKVHYTGEKNDFGQIYTTRNCLFEPSTAKDVDWVKKCLKDIHTAFRWNKPAVISSHRLNFIGSLVEENRKSNLKQFKALLEAIVKTWPTVEFVSSDQLAKIISDEGEND